MMQQIKRNVLNYVGMKHSGDMITTETNHIYIGMLHLSQLYSYFRWIAVLKKSYSSINAQLAAQAKWCPVQLENLSDNGPNISINQFYK